MKFEWDEEKNQSNIAKHGVSFGTATQIFQGPTLDRVDSRENYGEEHVISIGMIEGLLILVVVHTDREGVTRIISARRAKRPERERYDKEIRKRTGGQGIGRVAG